METFQFFLKVFYMTLDLEGFAALFFGDQQKSLEVLWAFFIGKLFWLKSFKVLIWGIFKDLAGALWKG